MNKKKVVKGLDTLPNLHSIKEHFHTSLEGKVGSPSSLGLQAMKRTRKANDVQMEKSWELYANDFKRVMGLNSQTPRLWGTFPSSLTYFHSGECFLFS